VRGPKAANVGFRLSPLARSTERTTEDTEKTTGKGEHRQPVRESLEPPVRLFVDADACPVKDEIYRVAGRYRIPVTLVANSRMWVPADSAVELVVVAGGLDAADDWIAGEVQPLDLVVTADIPLASRCIEAGARVISPRGEPFTEDNVGDALATRDLLTELRGAGMTTGGPPPVDKRQRSRFLQQLDEMIRGVERDRRRAGG
jgi:uncharacterized protein